MEREANSLESLAGREWRRDESESRSWVVPATCELSSAPPASDRRGRQGQREDDQQTPLDDQISS